MRLDVPELVRQRAESSGAAGSDWLRSLPSVVGELSERWQINVGAAFRGGTAGYVAAATDASGSPCVLKIAMPLSLEEHEAFHHSLEAHEFAAGRGCARLLNSDSTTAAMLLERLGPNLDDLGLDVAKIMEVIATTLRSFWRPVPAECSLPTGADKALWVAEFIPSMWSQLGKPCSRAVVDRAIAYCEDRAAAFDARTAVLVHGDAHGWNTLSAGDGTYKFVDVEGLVSEPAHDLAVPMREYNQPLLAGDTRRLTRKRAELLAGLCEVDAEAVWQWGFIERVSTGLANIRDFDGDGGLAFLEVAERCL